MLKQLGRAIALAVCLQGLAFAAEPVSKSRIGGVAIGGHDTMAYYELERAPYADAIEGEKTYTVDYKGAKWRFASAESAARFAEDPERYQPVYNGHCANALSTGNGLVRTDGEVWEIFDGELHLFYARAGLERWLAAGEGWREYRAAADAAWEQLSQ